MSKIAIDARFYGTHHTGLGRYTTNVLKYLPKYLRTHKLQVLLRADQFDSFVGGKNVEKVTAEIPHYSLEEQLKMPGLIMSLNSDLLYTFHFNTPIFSRIKTIVTVHDLIKTHYTGRDTTTRTPWIYSLKRMGYNKVIESTLQHAQDIIVPTNTVKNDILAHFDDLKPEKIHSIQEAPDEIFRSMVSAKLPQLPTKYILYVGNVYPHKNLPVLLEAVRTIGNIDLVIVAKPSPFLSRVLAPYDRTHIHILSNLSDSELVSVYQHADALITPSLMEGYGLVGLESMMVGTPVVASNIAVYREVYGKNVTYFDPHSVDGLVESITTVLKKKKPQPLKFDRTWDDVAKDIAEVINARCTRI